MVVKQSFQPSNLFNILSHWLIAIFKVRATGGLLKFLEKMRVGVELEDADVRVPVLDLKVYSL